MKPLKEMCSMKFHYLQINFNTSFTAYSFYKLYNIYGVSFFPDFSGRKNLFYYYVHLSREKTAIWNH